MSRSDYPNLAVSFKARGKFYRNSRRVVTTEISLNDKLGTGLFNCHYVTKAFILPFRGPEPTAKLILSLRDLSESSCRFPFKLIPADPFVSANPCIAGRRVVAERIHHRIDFYSH